MSVQSFSVVGMMIDCNTCQAAPSACGDCVMSVLMGADPMGTEVDDVEVRALEALADGGLVPPLRLVAPVRGASPADRLTAVRDTQRKTG